jgi:transposase-like protein
MKSENLEFPQTLQEAMAYFSDPARGLDFMVSLRWPGSKVICPHCQSEKVSFISTRSKWKCMACHKQFSAKVGTIFEDSALGYDKWFPAMWMIVNAKNGISSYEIARALGVTQKTAWFMLHRIRLAIQNGSFDKFGGEVESDESFIGGKAINMPAKKRRLLPHKGVGGQGKAIVHAMLERGIKNRKVSRVKAVVVPNTQKATIKPLLEAGIATGSNLYTDTAMQYLKLNPTAFMHDMVDHAVSYVNGKVHTNGLENFWSLLKRSLRGTYVSVEPFHLFRYLDEQVFRFNERKDCDAGRFLKAAQGVIGKGLRYLDLIDGKGGDDLLPQTAGAREAAQ